ncbi:UNVERIFIED_CONTAM: Metalloendoproteinase 1 [Sesamum latifolium]|uniref:Metalloendoproteinase 1 n=1 Tax=Sesamum latifolium TaxID=2727402 RepID=A0AAW2XYR4_9LAMI
MSRHRRVFAGAHPGKPNVLFSSQGPLSIWDEHLESPPFGESHYTRSRITTPGKIADSPDHQLDAQKPSAMDFLQILIGAQKGTTSKGISQLKNYLSHLGYMNRDNDTTPTRQRAPKWPPTKRSLTYSFRRGTRADVNNPILHATQMWASVSHFTFTYTPHYDRADIKISFEFGDHGDGQPFDGPGGILAHAFPPTDGRLHYDGDEKWVDGVTPGAIDMQTVGLHELGHVLGLGHTTDEHNIMSPFINSGQRKVLGQDDINGIRALYQS